MTTETVTSMYDRIGGQPTVRRVVHRLYAWILEDEHLIGYFVGASVVKTRAHLVILLSQLLGGPKTYTGRDLAAAHAGLAITDAHFNRVCDYLHAALLVEHAPMDILRAVQQIAEAQRPNIVTG